MRQDSVLWTVARSRGALARYLAEKDDLENGRVRTPKEASVPVAVADPIPTSWPTKPYDEFLLHAHKSVRCPHVPDGFLIVARRLVSWPARRLGYSRNFEAVLE